MSDIVKRRYRGRVWTPEQKAIQSEKMRAHWAEHGHPRTGAVVSAAQRAEQSRIHREMKPLGWCRSCGMAYFTETARLYGMGASCLKAAVAAGEVELDGNGKPVPLHLTSVHGMVMPACSLSMSEWEDTPVTLIPISDLQYSRQDWHPEMVLKWGMALEVPPIHVCQDDTGRWVKDGRYRVAAKQRFGDLHIAARVHRHGA